MYKWDDNPIPVCMLDIETNILPHMLTPPLHMEVFNQEKLKKTFSIAFYPHWQSLILCHNS